MSPKKKSKLKFNSSRHQQVVNEAARFYEKATTEASTLRASNPTRLGLHLNHAVFAFKVQNNPARAIAIA